MASLGDEFRIFSLPFSVPVNGAAPKLQMELHELQANNLFKQAFQIVALPYVYRFLDDASFPALRKQAARIIAKFGSTYLCEHLVSLLKVNKSAVRSRMTDEHLR
ncbi:general transcription factor II-I repeat domain-containing protein 2B-like [Haemaphysalis longicornis]